MKNSELLIKDEGGQTYIEGSLNLYSFKQAKNIFKKASGKTFNLSKITHLDTAGALALYQATTKQHIKLKNLQPEHQDLFDLVCRSTIAKSPASTSSPLWKAFVISIGKTVIYKWRAIIEFISFLGQSIIELMKILRHPQSLRFNSIIHHIKSIGIEAIPLISIIAFVISVVIAYQGQVQLQPLGVKQYSINLVAISILREMGVLLTAIMVAGRSGSNFTAEIGVMKVRQEVDALSSMGFNPFSLLVLPRLIALIIALPILTLLADIMGLLGGAVVSMTLMDIPLNEYIERAHMAVTWKDFVAGMIKAPIFAFVIALVGCMHGLKVSGSAESVGRETTISVVKSIFLVLILDGLFSIYFEKVGL